MMITSMQATQQMMGRQVINQPVHYKLDVAPNVDCFAASMIHRESHTPMPTWRSSKDSLAAAERAVRVLATIADEHLDYLPANSNYTGVDLCDSDSDDVRLHEV
jgi:hypothetical protein